MQIERIKVELAPLQQNRRRIRRKYWATRKSDTINNLRDAIQSNEWACAWRYAQLLSRSKNGPKKRIYGQVSQYAPLAPEWVVNLALPGTKKGCLATEYDFEHRSCTFREDNSSLQPPSHYDYEHELHAKKDLNKIVRAMKHIKLRKSVPSWSVPVELLAMLMLPDRKKTAPERLGIGFLGAPPVARRFHQVLLALLFCIRRSEKVPKIWDLAV